MSQATITATLVSELVRSQFPQWANLPVTPVESDGWDNRTFRLGRAMSARLPSDDAYVPQIEKEHRWLPILAPRLPLPIPEPLAKGSPGCGFNRPWSVYRWLHGENASTERLISIADFASGLAGFLVELHRTDPLGGPPPGAHNFFRGGPLAIYDTQTRDAIAALADDIDSTAATAVWDAALDAEWDGRPVWVHGDMSASNLLVDNGRLSAVIDFGCCAIGDPACDTAIAWTFFPAKARRLFRSHLEMDHETWARGRAWALWKALITHRESLGAGTGAEDVAVAGLRFGWRWNARHVIDEVLNDSDDVA